MDQINDNVMKVIQRELLDIIKSFHSFCIENDIVYTLYGGSCIGAVRHQGFIPWDDDLDICVDRENYNRIMKSFYLCKDLKMHRTLWINRVQKTNPISIEGYIPTLDILVIDNAPDSNVIFKLKNLKLSMLQGMLKEGIEYNKFSLVYKTFLFVTHCMGKLFAKETLRKWYDKTAQIGDLNNTKYVHCTYGAFKWIWEKYPANTWSKVKLVKFEDTMVYIPELYDIYLSKRYGNYMQFPKEEERRPLHFKRL